MGYIKEDKIQRSNIGYTERNEIKAMAKEAFNYVSKGGDPRDLPKALRTE